MDTFRIAVMIGSLRQDSLNRKLALALAGMAPPEFKFHHCRIDDLPPYNQDDDGRPPEPVRRLKTEIADAQGVLFVTPEYNRSIPGVLKNAIDHASRPYGQSAWAGKPAGVIGVSVGSIGTAMAQQHLRNILAYLDMPTLGQPEAFIANREGLFDDKGHVGLDDSRRFLQTWMDRYTAWVRDHAKM
ncbi:MAG TPA: NAD(P)H-dependent oxidoreductase [Ramlibacter sp.]|jgi:chromate reductase|uniref:NADPH-dependent FMN reductase n=1 Tax=Ramlibacter sp. TaxID=1917967 RepID=UPI002D650B3F|nr:NAD(P)H-dependent oxidoreductase [Ramlibacter sp.]HZY18348.1 NAD(P)H-dependent oxidoreductase [Ramlibacter sp.]